MQNIQVKHFKLCLCCPGHYVHRAVITSACPSKEIKNISIDLFFHGYMSYVSHIICRSARYYLWIFDNIYHISLSTILYRDLLTPVTVCLLITCQSPGFSENSEFVEPPLWNRALNSSFTPLLTPHTATAAATFLITLTCLHYVTCSHSAHQVPSAPQLLTPPLPANLVFHTGLSCIVPLFATL